MKRYIVMETNLYTLKTIKYAEFDNKTEAEDNMDNLSIMFAENGYEIIEQEVEE
jgi:hypothetical protein